MEEQSLSTKLCYPCPGSCGGETKTCKIYARYMEEQDKIVLLSVKMTLAERQRIDQAAAQTFRTRSSVVRQVLSLLDRPEVRAALGADVVQPISEVRE